MQARSGDDAARDQLCSAYLPMLQRWARGRLPDHARNLSDTDDMVQMTLIKALNRLDQFTPRREGAFLAYLRQILLNTIRDEIRKTARWVDAQGTLEDVKQPLLEQLIDSETVERYERSLLLLSEKAREAVILRVEMGFSYPEIAAAMQQKSANAARMLVSRSLTQLAERMQ